MNLHDLPVGIGDPIDTLFSFHRRVERQLATLAALAGDLPARGVDAEAVATAESLIDFFARAMQQHHDDEDDLLRALGAARRGPGPAVDSLRDRLQAEHRELDRTWRALARSLRAVSEGASRTLSEDLVRYFRTSHAVHISIEESALQGAARTLTAGERASLARGMAARRTRSYRFR